MKKVILTTLTIILLLGCNEENILDTMIRDVNYIDPQQDHSVYFKIADSAQNQDYSLVYGEDSDYTNLPAMSFKDNGDGSIFDVITGLVWTKCSMNADFVMDSSVSCNSGTHTKYNWKDAVFACENLVHASKDDWRLPKIHELYSLVSFGQEGVGKAAIDPVYFPNTEFEDIYYKTTPWDMDDTRIWIAFGVGMLKYYWTLSQWSDDGYAQMINFDDGHSNLDEFAGKNYVRCVRN